MSELIAAVRLRLIKPARTRLMREAEGGDVASGKESADQDAPRDWQIEMRRARLVVVNGDARRARPPQVVACQRLQRIDGRLVVGAFDANGDALTGLKKTRRWHDWNLQLVDLARFEWVASFVGLNRLPRRAVVAQTALRGS